MDVSHKDAHFLDYTTRPAFCVKNGKIVSANAAACQRQICEGLSASDFLDDLYAYEEFEAGVLCQSVHFDGIEYGASITRTEHGYVFVLETPYTNDALQAMALAAQHLRRHLSDVVATAQNAPENSRPNADMIRGLYRMQRALCNMSDIPLIRSKAAPVQMLDLGSAVYEIIEKAANLLEPCSITIKYTGDQKPIHTTADRELLERAIYNLLSNAAKFTENGGTIHVSLTKKKNSAVLTIEDAGSGIPTQLYGSLFSQYQREASISGGLQDIGLGLALVQSVAAHHGGAVLITGSAGGGTRVALSLPIHTAEGMVLRSPILPIGDYAGGFDHGLLELSDVLPSRLFYL